MGVSRTKAVETFPWSFLLSINNCGLSCGSMLKLELAGRQLPRKVIGTAGTGLPSYLQQGYRDMGASPEGGKVPQYVWGFVQGWTDALEAWFFLSLHTHMHTHTCVHTCAHEQMCTM